MSGPGTRPLGSEGATPQSGGRQPASWPGALSLIALAGVLMATGCNRSQRISRPEVPPVQMPVRTVAPEDFTTSADRAATDFIRPAFENAVTQFLERHVARPLYDDVVTRSAVAEGIQIREGQFPDRPDLLQAVNDCARVFSMSAPRVYLHGDVDGGAVASGFSDPVILFSSRYARDSLPLPELRFILGHEMGHLKAEHVGLRFLVMSVARWLAETPIFPDEIPYFPLLPALKWAREAEMSADNAGLLCSQDPPASERALLRLLLGDPADDPVGRIDVDVYLHQGAGLELSDFSEATFLAKQISTAHPFVPDRVKQIRQFAATRYVELLRAGR